MDSKPKTDVGLPQVEMPEIHLDEGRAPRRIRWQGIVGVLLVAGAIAIGLVVARSGGEGTPGVATTEMLANAPWLAAPALVEVVEANAAALNAANEAVLAATYAESAVVIDTIAGTETAGPDAIAAYYSGRVTDLEITSEVVGFDGSAAHSFTYSGGSGLLVFGFDDGLKIVRQWIMGVTTDGGTEGTMPDAPWLASPDVREAVEANAAALNAANEAALAATYAESAVVTDTIAGTETAGPDAIAATYAGRVKGLEITSEVVAFDDFALHSFTYHAGSGLLIFQLDEDLKIVHQWIVGT